MTRSVLAALVFGTAAIVAAPITMMWLRARRGKVLGDIPNTPGVHGAGIVKPQSRGVADVSATERTGDRCAGASR
jgi:hypothetical protein